jgi:sodium/potassium/calcium exchanger 6
MFLSTSITKIVETFNINQNIAAVTLLAFGNGAPDVISSLVASAEEEGIQFSINSLIGGGMFVTSFVLGAVVFRGKDILVNSSMFNRNLILYLISLGHIILIGIKKKITLFDSLGFIFIYILNILVAFCQGRKSQNIESENIEMPIGDKDINSDNKNMKEIKDINALINDTTSNYKQIELEQKNDSLDYFYREIINAPLEKSMNKEDIIGEIKEDIEREQELFINNKKAYKEVISENMILAKIYFKKKYLSYKEEEWGEISPYWKVFYIVIDLPLTYIRELTIPNSEKKNWNKRK